MNTGDLIGQLLQSGLSRGAGSRMQAASRNQPGLSGLLGGLLGGGGASGGGLGGLSEMAGEYLGQAKHTAKQNPKLAAGGLGALVGTVLGGGKMSSALGGAAMGVIGMLAMNALRGSGQADAAPAAVPADVPASDPVPAEAVPPPSEATQRLILMAMISAAKADGHVDDVEMTAIVGKLKEAGTDAEERDWVLRELSQPLDIETLVASVPSLEVGVQVYAASTLAITADTPQEQAYLDQLAQRLGIEPAVRSYIHQSLGLTPPA